MAEALREDLEAGNYDLDPYWYAVGCFALAIEEPIKAIDALKKAAEMSDDFAPRYLLGMAYFDAGELAKAWKNLKAS